MGKLRQKIKHSKLYYPLSIIRWSLKDIPLIIGSIWFRMYPIKNNKIVFSSFHGEQYNAQPKCIFEWLENNTSSEMDLVWILPDELQSSSYRTVRPASLKSVYELMTAGTWVDNCRKPYWLKKRKPQLYIQTWHGPVCIKAIEKDAKEMLSPIYVASAIQDSKNANYIVAETKWRRENIINSFWFNGPIINGRFIIQDSENECECSLRVREYYHLNDSIQIATYVPTFRNSENLDCYYSDYNLLINTLKEKYGGEWVVIVRLHPNIASKADLITYNQNVLDGTKYSNSDDLIIASDLIITDYSGCMFDAYQYKKRVIIYAEDYDEYIKNDRSFYFDFAKLPAPLVKSSEELALAIRCFNDEEYENRRRKFVGELGYYSDNAAEKCGEVIIRHTKERNGEKL